MKKLFSLVIGIFLMFIFVGKVDAQITFKEVADKYEELVNTNLVDEDAGITISKSDNAIITTSTLGEDDGFVYTTSFNYSDGVITYNYNGDEFDVAHSLVDALLIGKLLDAVTDLRYDAETLENLDIDEESLTFEKNGIEFKLFKHEFDDGSGYVEGCSSVRIDINRFNLSSSTSTGQNNNGSSQSSNQSTNQSGSNDVENPQTGFIVPGCLLVGFIASIIIFNKKRKFYKI